MEQETPTPVDLTQLTDQIRVVALARNNTGAISQLAKESLADWNERNKELLASLAEHKENLATGENLLRELTIAAYTLTGNKALVPGVGIREVKVYTYDEKEALKWALEHKLALSLDTKAFEGYAKQEDFDFVSTSIKVSATIATDLDAALAGEL